MRHAHAEGRVVIRFAIRNQRPPRMAPGAWQGGVGGSAEVVPAAMQGFALAGFHQSADFAQRQIWKFPTPCSE